MTPEDLKMIKSVAQSGSSIFSRQTVNKLLKEIDKQAKLISELEKILERNADENLKLNLRVLKAEKELEEKNATQATR